MNVKTKDFLAALLFVYPANDEGENPMEDKTIYDFSPEFIAAVDGFISSFEDYLLKEDIEIPVTELHFGGNVYYSLSGHGCGFQDEEDTEEIHAALIKFAGNRWKFEQIDLAEDENGKLDLSFMPQYRKEYRDRLFSFSD